VGSDDDVIKLTKKHTPIMIPLTQKPPPKLKKKIFYFKLHDATSRYRVWTALQLNLLSSCAWLKLPKTGFLTHDFGYRYASKSTKGSIDADFDLVFNKTFESKEWVNGLGAR